MRSGNKLGLAAAAVSLHKMWKAVEDISYVVSSMAGSTTNNLCVSCCRCTWKMQGLTGRS